MPFSFLRNKDVIVCYISLYNLPQSIVLLNFTLQTKGLIMTIEELILAGLQTKFAGVDNAILARIAAKKAEGVTDESKVNSIVEGISFADVLVSYGDYRAGQAQSSAVANYEKKHGLKNGKPTEPNKEPDPNKEEVPAWAQALIDSNKSLSEEISQMKAAKAQATRQEHILAKAKEYGIPEKFVKRCAIKDDEDLDAYLKDLKQDFANEGFKGVVPPQSAEQKIEENSQELASLINKGTEEINKK